MNDNMSERDEFSGLVGNNEFGGDVTSKLVQLRTEIDVMEANGQTRWPDDDLDELAEEMDGFDFETGEEFLLYHSRAGNVKVVEKLLQLKEKDEIELDPNCKGKQKSNYGWTPLHLASYFGHLEVVQLLLKNGANVNVINETGDTPLHKSAYTGRNDIVVHLLANNADLYIANGEGQTARDMAQKESVRDIILAAEEADLRKKEDKFLSASRNGDIDVIKELLSDKVNPVDINCQDMAGNTALHCAAYRFQKEAAVYLLKSGIDPKIKNNRNQVAAVLAPTIQMKQLLQEIQPVNVTLNLTKTVTRFEGQLLRKSRFLGWRQIWTVAERGVLMFFSNRADASIGKKRKGYKYLENAVVEPVASDAVTFTIYFSDKSRVQLSLTQSPSNLFDRQKWVNVIRDHAEYSTNFVRQGIRVDDDDELSDLMPIGAIQSMIQTAQAHESILSKHIKAIMQLVEEDLSEINSINSNSVGNSKFYGPNEADSNIKQVQSVWPTLKFHLSLITEAAKNTNTSLSQCLAVLSEQEELRQLQLRQEQEKCRVLEGALHVLAKEHHDLERSLVSVPYHSPPRPQSCMTDTDDEFYDAFEDEDDRNSDENNGELNGENNGDSTEAISAAFQTPCHSIRDENEHLSKHYRNRLPAPMVSRNDYSLWSILKHCIGKELSKITMPVVFNEPLSLLQRVTENMEYVHLLTKADLSNDPVERLEYVCAFAVSSCAANWERMNKPFNPLLGETFEYVRDDLGFRVICEQVSHHPPISAWFAESKHFQFNGSVHPKLKFWGKSIEVKPEGLLTLKLLKHNETYTFRAVNCCVHNIIVGKLWYEQYGTMDIVCHQNGLKAQLSFKPAGWFGKNLNCFDGFIYSEDKCRLRYLYGKWTDYMKSASVTEYDNYMKRNGYTFRVPDRPNTDPSASPEINGISTRLRSSTNSHDVADAENVSILESESTNGNIPKSSSSNSLDIDSSKLLWQVTPRPDYSSQYYHFTQYAMTLNEIDDDLKLRLPKTDSRLRPDIRLMEEGDIDGAVFEKDRLEEKQREARKIRRNEYIQWTPLWFKQGKHNYANEEVWNYSHCYWDRDFSKCLDIF